MRRRCFTLLEVMIGLSILLLAAVGIGGWKVQQLIEKKEFRSDIDKVRSRLLTYHRLSLNMQADWKVTLEKKGKKWVFSEACVDQPTARGLPPSALHSFAVFLNGEPKNRLIFEFSATGEVSPAGNLLFVQKTQKESFKIPQIFHKQESSSEKKEFSPLHPQTLRK